MMLMSAAVFALASLSCVHAHMRIQTPPPLRGENNPFYNDGNVDYDMTSPLAPDGSNFPCKGYQTDIPSVSTAVVTLTAGQPLTLSMGGSASHGGGSCQFSLSYDNGKTFGVITGSNILLAWSWFNLVGNREMYMNCIAVDLQSSNTGSVTLPRMFEANNGNGCTTIEGKEVDFAAPQAMLTGCDNPILLTDTVTLTSNGAPSGSAPAPSDVPTTPSNNDPDTTAGGTPKTSTSTRASPGAHPTSPVSVTVNGRVFCRARHQNQLISQFRKLK
ncbi:hypothetical protein BKA62DRAFT_701754 [Auriculariales sp. MPI-PUGE-AT-0066]|nr:hypothetical protein BKA62DRAFT_701754 [Auriculariales sp. MPI-PUGE-AT-0066]